MRDKKFLFKLIFIIAIPLIIGIVCVGFACVMQTVLMYERYGVIFNTEAVFIPHWSAWFFLGVVGAIPATFAEQIL